MLAQNSTLGKSRANKYLLLLLLFPLKYPILKKFSGKYTQMSLERFPNKVFRTSVTPVYRKTEGSAFLSLCSKRLLTHFLYGSLAKAKVRNTCVCNIYTSHAHVYNIYTNTCVYNAYTHHIHIQIYMYTMHTHIIYTCKYPHRIQALNTMQI